MQELRLHGSRHVAQVAILVQTITSSSGLDAVVFIRLQVARCCCCWLGTVSLTINLSFLQPTTPRKLWGFLGFFWRCQVGDSAYTYPGGVLKPTTLVDSQIHQPDASDTSAGCLAPPLRCLRDLFSVGPVAERGCFSQDGAIWLSSDRSSIASCCRYLRWFSTLERDLRGYNQPHTLRRLCSSQVTCSGKHHQKWGCCQWQGPHWPRQEWWCFWDHGLLWLLWQTGRTR